MYLPELFKREKPGGHFYSVACRMGCVKFEVIAVVGIGLLRILREFHGSRVLCR